MRPAVSTDCEMTVSLPSSWRQVRFVRCRLGQNCNRTTCHKKLFELELDGQYFLFTDAHFGIKTSGNAFHAVLSSLIRNWKITYNARIILWVDDICVIVPNICTEQDTCGGADDCPECSRGKLRAWEPDAQFQGYQNRTCARALTAGLPRQDHVYKTTDESFRFHNKKIDEIRSKLYSTENSCSS